MGRDGTAGIVEARFMKSTEATTNAISFSSSAPTPAARSACLAATAAAGP